jgi:MinD superfamily P-loop ATPase
MLCPEKALKEKGKVIGKVQKGVSDQVNVCTGILNTGEASGVPIIKNLLDDKNIVSGKYIFIDCPPGSACIVLSIMVKRL